MRKGIVLLLTIVMMFVLAPTSFAAQSEEIKVYYDQKRLEFAIPPVAQDGRTLVQFRPIFEALGFEVGWDGDQNLVTAIKDDLEIRMILGQNNVEVIKDGRITRQRLEVPPQAINGHTLVPLRFVSETSGKKVEWHGKERKITIDSGYVLHKTYDPFGRDSFVPLEDSPYLTSIKPDFHKENEYFYVTWYEPVNVPFGDLRGYNFYVSVAKNGKWIHKNKKFDSVLRTGNVGELDILFFDGAYYIRDRNSIQKIKPTQNGSGTKRTIASNLPHYENSRGSWMKPVLLNGETAILFGTEYTLDDPSSTLVSVLRVYYVGDDSNRYYNNKYDEIKDVYGVLKSVKPNDYLIYDQEKKLMHILELNGYRTLKTDTGDLIYDKDGKDRVIPFSSDKTERTINYDYVINNGNVYVLYTREGDRTLSVSHVSDKMKVSEPEFTNVDISAVRSNFVTIDHKKGTIELWKFYIHSRKPAVHMTEYKRPY